MKTRKMSMAFALICGIGIPCIVAAQFAVPIAPMVALALGVLGIAAFLAGTHLVIQANDEM